MDPGGPPIKMASEIRCDAVLFPIAITGGFGAFGTVNFLWHCVGNGRGPARLGLAGCALAGLANAGGDLFGATWSWPWRAFCLTLRGTSLHHRQRFSSTHGMNLFRTGLLMAAMTGLFLAVGYLVGGQTGMVIAFLFAAGTNLFAYWNSDKVLLRMYGARRPTKPRRPISSILCASSGRKSRAADAQGLYRRQRTAQRFRHRAQSRPCRGVRDKRACCRG